MTSVQPAGDQWLEIVEDVRGYLAEAPIGPPIAVSRTLVERALVQRGFAPTVGPKYLTRATRDPSSPIVALRIEGNVVTGQVAGDGTVTPLAVHVEISSNGHLLPAGAPVGDRDPDLPREVVLSRADLAAVIQERMP